MRIRPFHMIRPIPSRAATVSSPPYDVMTTREARALAENQPDSFLHVIRPEIDLPDGTSPTDDAVYAKAAENLDRFVDTGVLQRDEKPLFAIYRLAWKGRSQFGIVCCCHVNDYLQNVIRRHEKTRPDKEDDRTRHLLTIDAHTGPVLTTYRDQAAIDNLISMDTAGRPFCHFISSDGVTHTLWTTRKPQAYIDAFASLPEAYIADGHHRIASAARAAQARQEEYPEADEDAEFNWFLAVLFPASQLNLLPYNRSVRSLGELSEEEFLGKLAEVGRVEPTSETEPDRKGVVCIALPGGWYRLELEAGVDADPVSRLDAALLQDRVFGPILGIEDPRTDQRLEFIGGIKGSEELQRRIEHGDAAAAFALFPTSIKDVIEVSDAGLCMPPKSTWFEPKLRSGLFVHAMDSTASVED